LQPFAFWRLDRPPSGRFERGRPFAISDNAY
jgi:hypothetical protein